MVISKQGLPEIRAMKNDRQSAELGSAYFNPSHQSPCTSQSSESAESRTLVRHEGECPREKSACGWRDRLISREDAALSPAAWAHAVDIDGAKPHYHKRSTEIYYVLDGSGSIILDGEEHEIAKGSLVHIPPMVVHGAIGKMRVLVLGIPDIDDDDYFLPEDR